MTVQMVSWARHAASRVLVLTLWYAMLPVPAGDVIEFMPIVQTEGNVNNSVIWPIRVRVPTRLQEEDYFVQGSVIIHTWTHA